MAIVMARDVITRRLDPNRALLDSWIDITAEPHAPTNPFILHSDLKGD